MNSTSPSCSPVSMDWSPNPISDSSLSSPSPSPSEQKTSQIFQNTLPVLEAPSTFSSQQSQSKPCESTPSVLINKRNFIFIYLHPGKPDPKAPSSPATLQSDDRPRTIQPGAKFETCWYYALNMIRHRIGKHPSPELQSARAVEKDISSVRKKYTNITTTFPEFYSDDTESRLATKQLKRADVEQILDHWEDFQETYEPQPGNPSIVTEFKAFLGQKEYVNFYAFMKARLDNYENKIAERFLAKSGIFPQKFFEHTRQIDPINHRTCFQNLMWDQLSDNSKSALLHTYTIYAAGTAYGLNVSNWSPFQPFKSLIQTLRKEGPLVVGGHFGFDKTVRSNEKILGRAIYTPDLTEDVHAHVITLIGAKADELDGGTIYYVNPNDASFPGKPRKVYSMPFQILKENIMNHLSYSQGDRVPSPIGYAWSNPR